MNLHTKVGTASALAEVGVCDNLGGGTQIWCLMMTKTQSKRNESHDDTFDSMFTWSSSPARKVAQIWNCTS